MYIHIFSILRIEYNEREMKRRGKTEKKAFTGGGGKKEKKREKINNWKIYENI